MRGRDAVFTLVYGGPEFYIIRDTGDHTKVLTVTNDAERVVERLIASGALDGHLNLYVYDSLGELDEFVYVGGKFDRFVTVSRYRRTDMERMVEARAQAQAAAQEPLR